MDFEPTSKLEDLFRSQDFTGLKSLLAQMPPADAADEIARVDPSEQAILIRLLPTRRAAEEATEDIHKIGGMEHLEEPYLQITLGRLVSKRAT